MLPGSACATYHVTRQLSVSRVIAWVAWWNDFPLALAWLESTDHTALLQPLTTDTLLLQLIQTRVPSCTIHRWISSLRDRAASNPFQFQPDAECAWRWYSTQNVGGMPLLGGRPPCPPFWNTWGGFSRFATISVACCWLTDRDLAYLSRCWWRLWQLRCPAWSFLCKNPCGHLSECRRSARNRVDPGMCRRYTQQILRRCSRESHSVELDATACLWL